MLRPVGRCWCRCWHGHGAEVIGDFIGADGYLRQIWQQDAALFAQFIQTQHHGDGFALPGGTGTGFGTGLTPASGQILGLAADRVEVFAACIQLLLRQCVIGASLLPKRVFGLGRGLEQGFQPVMALAVPVTEGLPALGQAADLCVPVLASIQFWSRGEQVLIAFAQFRFLGFDPIAHVVLDSIQYQQRGVGADHAMPHGQAGNGLGIRLGLGLQLGDAGLGNGTPDRIGQGASNGFGLPHGDFAHQGLMAVGIPETQLQGALAGAASGKCQARIDPGRGCRHDVAALAGRFDGQQVPTGGGQGCNGLLRVDAGQIEHLTAVAGERGQTDGISPLRGVQHEHPRRGHAEIGVARTVGIQAITHDHDQIGLGRGRKIDGPVVAGAIQRQGFQGLQQGVGVAFLDREATRRLGHIAHGDQIHRDVAQGHQPVFQGGALTRKVTILGAAGSVEKQGDMPRCRDF